MRPNPVISTRATVEIHPYVQARLRALSRQDETSGILLGSSSDGITRVTGFKRAAPAAMFQAACDAGPALAGFYRLQTPGAVSLRPDEEALLRRAQSTGRGLFLLVKAAGDKVDAIAWTREPTGEAAIEQLSLDNPPTEPTPVRPSVVRVRMAEPVISRRLLSTGGIAVAAAAAATYWRLPPQPALGLALSLSLLARDGELVAAWEQQNTPAARLELATLAIQEGASERTTDITSTYSPHGQVTLRPRASDLVVTLRVQYAGAAAVSRSATYLGFRQAAAPAATPPSVQPDPELAALRKRNRELQDALAALRKHVFQ